MESASATALALAASKKDSKRVPSMIDYMTEVAVKGEVGREDAEALRCLIGCTSIGIAPTEANSGASPKIRQFFHTASRDSSAPLGRLRLLLLTYRRFAKCLQLCMGKQFKLARTWWRLKFRTSW